MSSDRRSQAGRESATDPGTPGRESATDPGTPDRESAGNPDSPPDRPGRVRLALVALTAFLIVTPVAWGIGGLLAAGSARLPGAIGAAVVVAAVVFVVLSDGGSPDGATRTGASDGSDDAGPAAEDDGDGSVWNAIPSWQYGGRHVESGGLSRDEQERSLREIESQAEELERLGLDERDR